MDNGARSDYDCPTLALIRQHYDDMTRVQQQIADYILENPTQVVKCSISSLAKRTGAKSEASVVRFYRSLGFAGYKDFKIRMAQDLAGKTFYHSYEDIKIDDTSTDIKKKIFNAAITTLAVNAALEDDAAYEAALSLLINASRIVLLGYAASAAVCYYAYFRFLELGLDCHFSADSHINAAILTKPNPGDVFFCVSISGETRDIVLPLGEAAEKGAKIISLTACDESTLAKMSDAVILTKTEETNLITDAMNARVSQLCSIDSLFSMLSIAKGDQAFNRLMLTRRTFYDYKK